MCHAEWPGREMTASENQLHHGRPRRAKVARTSQAAAGSRLPAVPGRASTRGCAQPGARPSSGGGAGLPGLAPAAAWRPPSYHPPAPLTSARGREAATAPLRWEQRGQDVPRPFRFSLTLASGTTRAEQTGSTTRGGRPLCDVIRPRRPYCGPAGFPR